MENNQKSLIYGDLLNEHTKIFNKINEIKGQNINLSQTQISEINNLEQKQVEIMKTINRLLTK